MGQSPIEFPGSPNELKLRLRRQPVNLTKVKQKKSRLRSYIPNQVVTTGRCKNIFFTTLTTTSLWLRALWATEARSSCVFISWVPDIPLQEQADVSDLSVQPVLPLCYLLFMTICDIGCCAIFTFQEVGRDAMLQCSQLQCRRQPCKGFFFATKATCDIYTLYIL